MKVLFTNLSKTFYQQPNSQTGEQKRLLLDLPDLGIIYLQTRNKLQKALKVLQTRNYLMMSNKTFPILSVTKTRYPKNLYLALFINLSVLSAMSPIIVKVSKHF